MSKGHTVTSLFSTTDNAFHAQFRRGVSAAFAMSSLVQYEQFVDSTTRIFMQQTERLFARTGQVCNLADWIQYYAFDVIGEITYSTRHGFVEGNEDVNGLIKSLHWVFDYAAPVSWMLHVDNVIYSR